MNFERRSSESEEIKQSKLHYTTKPKCCASCAACGGDFGSRELPTHLEAYKRRYPSTQVDSREQAS